MRTIRSEQQFIIGNANRVKETSLIVIDFILFAIICAASRLWRRDERLNL
jgi:hypothetical protein